MQQTISLEQIPEALRQKKHDTQYNVALWIFKYQKFNINAAMQHAPEGYSAQTLKMYRDKGLHFLRTGTVKGNYKGLCSNLDQLIKNHTQPLTPSFKDAKRVFKKDYTRKDNPPPVAKLEIVNKPLISKCQYGIQTETTIRLCPSEDYAMGFLDALKESGDEISKIVTVEIGEP